METQYDWYLVFNKQTFLDTGLASRTYTYELEGRGEKNILVTKGNLVAMTFDDAFLPVDFLGNNPYDTEGYAVYIDEDDNVYLGFEIGS